MADVSPRVLDWCKPIWEIRERGSLGCRRLRCRRRIALLVWWLRYDTSLNHTRTFRSMYEWVGTNEVLDRCRYKGKGVGHLCGLEWRVLPMVSGEKSGLGSQVSFDGKNFGVDIPVLLASASASPLWIGYNSLSSLLIVFLGCIVIVSVRAGASQKSNRNPPPHILFKCNSANSRGSPSLSFFFSQRTWQDIGSMPNRKDW